MTLTRSFETQLRARLKEPKPLLQILLDPRQVGKTTAARAIYESWRGPKIMENDGATIFATALLNPS